MDRVFGSHSLRLFGAVAMLRKPMTRNNFKTKHVRQILKESMLSALKSAFATKKAIDFVIEESVFKPRSITTLDRNYRFFFHRSLLLYTFIRKSAISKPL